MTLSNGRTVNGGEGNDMVGRVNDPRVLKYVNAYELRV
jgi:hypothetical protein